MKTILLSFLFSYSAISTAQLSHNFELLDHRTRQSALGANELVNNQIFYVSHNDQQPMTSLNVCNDRNEIQTILESPFTSKSKKIITSDSTFRIYIYDLFDYDVHINGFYEFNYSPGAYTIDTLLSYSNSSEYLVVNDVLKDSLSRHYILEHNTLYHTDNETVINTFHLDNISGPKLYKSPQLDIFIYSKNLILHFDGVGLNQVADFNQNIIDIKAYEDYNLILFKGTLMAIESDFETILSEWIIPEDLNSFDQVFVQDSTILALSSDMENINVFSLSPQNQSQLLYSSPLNENEAFTGFIPLSNERFLLTGKLSTGDISENLFFRNHSFMESTTYLRHDVDISTFKLTQTGFDTSSFFVPSPGDTVFSLRYYYDVQLDLQNNSDEEVIHFNIYSKNYFNAFGHGPSFLYNLESSIAPFESFLVDTSFSLTLFSLSAFYVSAPGANYRFNQSSKNVVLADFTSSVHSLKVDNSFAIFPNPVANFIYIKSESEVESLHIYNSSGVLVSFLSHDKMISKIDISHLGTGTYHGVCTYRNKMRHSAFTFVKI